MTNSSRVKLIRFDFKEKYQRLLDKTSGTSGIKAGHVILKPGENVGEHTTAEREEIIIVLKGKGEARVDKETILKIGKNSLLYIPLQMSHDIKNTGKTILEYIFITSPAKK